MPRFSRFSGTDFRPREDAFVGSNADGRIHSSTDISTDSRQTDRQTDGQTE